MSHRVQCKKPVFTNCIGDLFLFCMYVRLAAVGNEESEGVSPPH